MSRLLLKIRHFQAEDLGELHEIDRICFPEEIAFSRAELLFHLKHPQSISWLAEGSDGILGFVLGRIENPHCAHVLTLDVVPRARQRKIATRLMHEFHKELENRDIHVAILEVDVNNLKAQGLYGKLGYKRAGIILGYYRGTEHAYRMMRIAKMQD